MMSFEYLFFKSTESLIKWSMKKWKMSRVVDNIMHTLEKSLNNEKPSSESHNL